MPPISKNPYSDPKDPRHQAVEIRRAYEKKGYEIENGQIWDPKTRKPVDTGRPDPGELAKRRR